MNAPEPDTYRQAAWVVGLAALWFLALFLVLAFGGVAYS